MKEVLEIIAVNLDRLKSKNPLRFVFVTLLMILIIIIIDTVGFFQVTYKEVFLFIKYLLIAITGFSGPSTFNYLPKDHPKKQNISLTKTIANEHE